jgi:hypothetical protein
MIAGSVVIDIDMQRYILLVGFPKEKYLMMAS